MVLLNKRKISSPKAIAAAKLAKELGVTHARAVQILAEPEEVRALKAEKMRAEITRLELSNAQHRANFMLRKDAYSQGLGLAKDVERVLAELAKVLPRQLKGLTASQMPPIIKAEVHALKIQLAVVASNSA